jgi:uncharacterized protein YndB with AHSA1/START domain
MNEVRSKTEIPPVESVVTVAWDPERAFRRFTEKIAEWWPLETHSMGQEKADTVVFETREGGRVYERSTDGTETTWGTVLAWDPPHRFVMSWHPGREPSTAQELEVAFQPSEGGTRVAVTHTGWEKLGPEGATMQTNYSEGWVFVLDRYRGSAETGSATGS